MLIVPKSTLSYFLSNSSPTQYLAADSQTKDSIFPTLLQIGKAL